MAKNKGHKVNPIRVHPVDFPEDKKQSILKLNPGLTRLKVANSRGEQTSVFPDASQYPVLVAYTVYLTHFFSPCRENHDLRDRMVDAAHESGLIPRSKGYDALPIYVREPERARAQGAEEGEYAKYVKTYINNFLSFQGHHAFAAVYHSQDQIRKACDKIDRVPVESSQDGKYLVDALKNLDELAASVSYKYQQVYAAMIDIHEQRDLIQELWDNAPAQGNEDSEMGANVALSFD
jgi:hypothetical protein